MVRKMKKIQLNSELIYVAANVILAFAVALLSSVDFGLSMIVSPAYILSQKLGVLSFGQCEYVIQFLLFLILCLVMKRFHFTYLCAFFTGVFYGTILDIFRKIIPFFNESITPPGSYALWLRIVFFICGEILTAFSIALFFESYIPPQVYDFFVKTVSKRFHKDQTKCKRIFDFSFLVLSIVMTLVFFRKFVGIKWGTVIITLVNGVLIGWFFKQFDKRFEFVPKFKKFSDKIEKDCA